MAGPYFAAPHQFIANPGLAEVNGQCGCWAALYGNTHGEFLAASQLLQYLTFAQLTKGFIGLLLYNLP